MPAVLCRLRPLSPDRQAHGERERAEYRAAALLAVCGGARDQSRQSDHAYDDEMTSNIQMDAGCTQAHHRQLCSRMGVLHALTQPSCPPNLRARL